MITSLMRHLWAIGRSAHIGMVIFLFRNLKRPSAESIPIHEAIK